MNPVLPLMRRSNWFRAPVLNPRKARILAAVAFARA